MVASFPCSSYFLAVNLKHIYPRACVLLLQAMERSMELSKFMGSWYVIANIPTPFEKNAYNAMETYSVSLCNVA